MPSTYLWSINVFLQLVSKIFTSVAVILILFFASIAKHSVPYKNYKIIMNYEKENELPDS
jgi:hypothetical protein